MHERKSLHPCLQTWPAQSGTRSMAPRPPPRHSPIWASFLEQSTQRLFNPDPLHPGHYSQLSTATRVDFSLATSDLRGPTQHIPASELPADAVPVQTTMDGAYLNIIRSTTPFCLGSPPPAPPALTFQDHLDTLPDWKRELLVGAFQTGDSDSFGQQLLKSAHLFLCSDGGAKGNAGCFG
jgi:hypothetical protein